MIHQSEDKKIYYCCVSRGPKVILSEYTETKGSTFRNFTLDILKKFKEGTNIIEYKNCQYCYIMESSNKLIFLAAVERGFSQTLSFEMLNKMRSRFYRLIQASVYLNSKSFALNPEFKEELKILFINYSVNNVDKTEVAMLKMKEPQQVQGENLKNLMQRDDKLEGLIDKVDAMQDETSEIRENAKEVRRDKRKSVWAIRIFSFLVAVALIYIVIAFLGCGWKFEKCS